MGRWPVLTRKGLVGGIMVCAMVIGGCQGTDTGSKVDDTVEELAGKKTWIVTIG